MNPLSILWNAGVPYILRNASESIAREGYSPFSPCDPYSGGLSIIGSLAMAFGAPKSLIENWNGDDESCPVPELSWAYYMETLTFIESVINDDIDNWASNATPQECCRLLENCATRIEISVS